MMMVYEVNLKLRFLPTYGEAAHCAGSRPKSRTNRRHASLQRNQTINDNNRQVAKTRSKTQKPKRQ